MDNETYKHKCAVRQLCKWRHEWGITKFRAYLLKYNIPKVLIDDFYEQYSNGNKGEVNEWKNTLSQQRGLDI